MHCRIQHFFGRHQGRGFGSFGRGFIEGGGMGGRTFGMGRKLASVDLQLLILGLLAEKPRHGYEIIKALDERSKGFYIPSPGMVYPALTYLEEIGHATVEIDGARKLYHITEAGSEHLERNRGAADALFAQFSRVGERMERVRQAMRAEEAGEGTDSEHRRRGSEHERRGTEHELRGTRELLRARRDLKTALSGKWDASREEQQRIAEILKRATAEILGE